MKFKLIILVAGWIRAINNKDEQFEDNKGLIKFWTHFLWNLSDHYFHISRNGGLNFFTFRFCIGVPFFELKRQKVNTCVLYSNFVNSGIFITSWPWKSFSKIYSIEREKIKLSWVPFLGPDLDSHVKKLVTVIKTTRWCNRIEYKARLYEHVYYNTSNVDFLNWKK